MAKTYDGTVVFCHPHDEDGNLVGDGEQGCHYAVDKDGNPDMDRPLFYDAENGTYRDKTNDDPSHFAAYHQNVVELEVGGETLRVPDDQAERVRNFLEESQ